MRRDSEQGTINVMHATTLKVATALVAAGLTVSCSSTDSASDSSTAVTTTPAQTSAAPATPSGTTAAAKIDPNTASTSELAAAFEAAGISNPEKWADEVSEYGPYMPDTIEATLTEELGKYGIDDATLKSILNVLDPR